MSFKTPTMTEPGGPPLLAPEDMPNIEGLVTEDDTPVDSIVSEKQMRLLVEPLYSSWPGPGEGGPFVALANVGVFATDRDPAIVPDVLLSLGVELPTDWRRRERRSYFVWVFGKFPDLVLEIVSNRKGGEDTDKLKEYARLHIPYYVIFDPDNLLGGGELRVFSLHARHYEPIEPAFLSEIGLGLTFWEGTYEKQEGRWLRWCDQQGRVLTTGQERALAAEERASTAEERASTAEERASTAEERAARLEQKLRDMGVDPSSL